MCVRVCMRVGGSSDGGGGGGDVEDVCVCLCVCEGVVVGRCKGVVVE